jgi:hypothetical protein
MPVMHGVFYLIKPVEQPGHQQQFLDAVLYADIAPKSRNAVGSRSVSAFYFLAQFCIIISFALLFEVMCLQMVAIQ